MARIPLDPPRTRLYRLYRLAEWYARRTYGVVPDPLAAMAHHPRVLLTDVRFEASLVRWDRLDGTLKSLAVMASAVSIGCSWCVDFGYWISSQEGVTAEKLMYERAVEMSRTAAVNELVSADLPGCDLNYWTAILMLEAILEDEDESPNREGEEINGLETEDRQSIRGSTSHSSSIDDLETRTDVILVLEHMRGRHRALKKKLEMQKTQKRNSITSSPYPASRSSPSSHGTAR